MAIYFYSSVLLLVIVIFYYVHPQNVVQQYGIRKDLFSGIKSGEYSVFDNTGKILEYRIESTYSVLQNIRVIAYPSKQEVGRLKAKFKLVGYKGDISILDPKKNQWIDGTIREHVKIFGSFFNIVWNGDTITMETKVTSTTAKFFDANKQLLAQFKITSILGQKGFAMETYSTKYPDQLYFLGLAARDQLSSSKK